LIDKAFFTALLFKYLPFIAAEAPLVYNRGITVYFIFLHTK